MQCVIKESMDFRAHKKTQCYANQSPVLCLLLFTLYVNSHLPACNCTIHVHKRCFVPHEFGLLLNVKALSILTALLQRSSGVFTR